MKKLIAFAMLLVAPLLLIAQTDSIRKEILGQPESRTELIEKGRRLLLEKLEESDYDKVKAIKDYLIKEVQNAEYMAFYPIELMLLLYWTKDYDNVFESLPAPRSPITGRERMRIYPQNYELLPKLLELTSDAIPMLQQWIRSAALPPDEKEFLILHLDHLILDPTSIDRAKMNEDADKFLSAYPDSRYAGFVRSNIRIRYKPSNWGFAFEFFSGYGKFTDSLATKYKHTIPIGVAFDIQYKRFAFYLRDFIGFSKTRQDIPSSGGTWMQGSQARVFLPEFSIGYVVADSRRIKLSPFVGIASTDIGATEYDNRNNNSLEKAGAAFTTTWTAGFNADIKLRNEPKARIVSYGPEQAFVFLRIRYAYNAPQFNKHYSGHGGNLHYLTIGVGAFGKKLKREL